MGELVRFATANLVNCSQGAIAMNTAINNATEYRNLPLALLTESKTNPRRIFEDDPLQELVRSIRTQGILSPLLVRPPPLHDANMNSVRLYAEPYPEFYLDVADEMGIMVLDETAI
jgi:hypothetical protein